MSEVRNKPPVKTSKTTPTPLSVDLQRVDAKGTSNRIRTLEGKIIRGEARPDQILAWYHAQDPIDETNVLSVIKIESRALDESELLATMDSILQRTAKKASLYEDAAFQLFKTTPSYRQRLEGNYDRDVTRDYTKDDFLHTFVAAEMYWMAAGIWGSEAIQRTQPNLLETEVKRIKGTKAAITLFDFVANLATDTQRYKDPQILMLGVEAQLKLDSLTQQSTHDQVSEIRKAQLLTDAIRTIDRVFLGEGELLTNPNLPKAVLKGKLLEFMWLIDAHMYLRMQGDFSTIVIPTARYEDMPQVGRPDLKRGADITVRNFETGTNFLIQLKSSREQTRPYHPAITVVQEDNFQDTSFGRLRNKLGAYKRYIESGFDPAFQADALRYILPSVREIFTSEVTGKNTLNLVAKAHEIDHNPNQLLEGVKGLGRRKI